VPKVDQVLYIKCNLQQINGYSYTVLGVGGGVPERNIEIIHELLYNIKYERADRWKHVRVA
jgi:hypothetical protein